MADLKRLLREVKREVKQIGNRKRRRFLKNLAAAPEEFEFGYDRTDILNTRRRSAELGMRSEAGRLAPPRCGDSSH